MIERKKKAVKKVSEPQYEQFIEHKLQAGDSIVKEFAYERNGKKILLIDKSVNDISNILQDLGFNSRYMFWR